LRQAIAVGLNRRQRRDRHRFQNGRVVDSGPHGLQSAANRSAGLLLLAPGVGNLAGEVTNFARGLDHHRKL
jgi:hypothetical protein